MQLLYERVLSLVFSNLLFLFGFFPLTMIAYRIANTIKVKNIILLTASLVFYSFGEPKYILLLVLMTFADWLATLLMNKKPQYKKLFLIIAVAVNLGLLGVFKYGNFFAENLGLPSPGIILPIGISFYTFQLLTYVVDVYRGEAKVQKNYFTLLLYASLFHQCIAGPIVRYTDVEEQLANRRETPEMINRGITRFSVGLAKKAVFANACGALATQFLTGVESQPALAVIVGMLCYTLQIYLDFSAYSDMAIGMGLMAGIRYHENFNYPYISRSVTEFWRRWHISLSFFFRDYVYIPLGGNRKGPGRTTINLLITWFLTGFWHGASWNFVLWGLYYFVFIMIERLFLRPVLDKHKIFSHIYLLAVVFFGWILFYFTDIGQAGSAFVSMFGANGFTTPETTLAVLNNLFIIIAAAAGCTPLLAMIGRSFSKIKSLSGLYRVCDAVFPVLLIVVSAAKLVGDSYNPFLYFQF